MEHTIALLALKLESLPHNKIHLFLSFSSLRKRKNLIHPFVFLFVLWQQRTAQLLGILRRKNSGLKIAGGVRLRLGELGRSECEGNWGQIQTEWMRPSLSPTRGSRESQARDLGYADGIPFCVYSGPACLSGVPDETMDHIRRDCKQGPKYSNEDLLEANYTVLQWIQWWSYKLW